MVTEFAFRVAGETGEGDIFDGVAGCKVGREFTRGVEDVLMCKHLFVLCAEGTKVSAVISR